MHRASRTFHDLIWALIGCHKICMALIGCDNYPGPITLNLKAYLFLFSFPTQPNGAMLLRKKMRNDVYFIASRHSDSKIVSETGSSFYVNQRMPFFRALLPHRAEPLSLRWWKHLKEMKRIRSVERVNHLCCWHRYHGLWIDFLSKSHHFVPWVPLRKAEIES